MRRVKKKNCDWFQHKAVSERLTKLVGFPIKEIRSFNFMVPEIDIDERPINLNRLMREFLGAKIAKIYIKDNNK